MLGLLFLAIVAAPGTREERQRSPATNALQVQCPRRYRNYTPSRFNSPSIAGISLKGGAVTRPDASVSRMLSLPVRLL
ncbi:hypothetical protein CGGC5_v010048 [Colletotrichum fructicola Nara gc5]|uniref:Secreted protein n=1 Tax=Colletotrichum fructicola (strain Nara gc5) TaxID=1213859 RepID=A0A7J6J1K9_COLFN|nr:hypothetical protein CGGC5_v010048 [Colletotrichum fructicola Nara gc5]